MTTFYVIPFFSSVDKRLTQNRKINLIIQYNPEFSCLHNNAPTFWIFLAVLSPNYQQFTLRQRWMFACKTTSFLRNSITDNLQKQILKLHFQKRVLKVNITAFCFWHKNHLHRCATKQVSTSQIGIAIVYHQRHWLSAVLL